MPIRFRCAYCNQLMGIARRKAGTVIRCPKCKGQVIVPQPADSDPESGPDPAGPNVFEQSNFSQAFEAGPGNLSTPGPKPHSPAASSPQAIPELEIDVEPVLLPGTGFFLTPGKLALLGVGIVVLMGLAFFAGLILGGGR